MYLFFLWLGFVIFRCFCWYIFFGIWRIFLYMLLCCCSLLCLSLIMWWEIFVVLVVVRCYGIWECIGVFVGVVCSIFCGRWGCGGCWCCFMGFFLGFGSKLCIWRKKIFFCNCWWWSCWSLGMCLRGWVFLCWWCLCSDWVILSFW